ncbi:putative nuclease HARBI1 [Ixodes scapularis]
MGGVPFPDLEWSTRRSCAPSADQQVIVALQFYATGNFLITAGDYVPLGLHGSTHDSRIFTESTLPIKLADDVYDVLLLGASGYTCQPWLMTPFLSPSSAAEIRYNTAHTSTRSIVERTIGQLKRRFHCLHAELRMEPSRCCDIIVACCVLQNLAKRYPCAMPGTAVPLEVPVEPMAACHGESNEARHALVDQFFCSTRSPLGSIEEKTTEKRPIAESSRSQKVAQKACFFSVHFFFFFSLLFGYNSSVKTSRSVVLNGRSLRASWCLVLGSVVCRRTRGAYAEKKCLFVSLVWTTAWCFLRAVGKGEKGVYIPAPRGGDSVKFVSVWAGGIQTVAEGQCAAAFPWRIRRRLVTQSAVSHGHLQFPF